MIFASRWESAATRAFVKRMVSPLDAVTADLLGRDAEVSVGLAEGDSAAVVETDRDGRVVVDGLANPREQPDVLVSARLREVHDVAGGAEDFLDPKRRKPHGGALARRSAVVDGLDAGVVDVDRAEGDAEGGDRLGAVDLGSGVEVRATRVPRVEHHDRPRSRADWRWIRGRSGWCGIRGRSHCSDRQTGLGVRRRAGGATSGRQTRGGCKRSPHRGAPRPSHLATHPGTELDLWCVDRSSHDERLGVWALRANVSSAWTRDMPRSRSQSSGRCHCARGRRIGQTRRV